MPRPGIAEHQANDVGEHLLFEAFIASRTTLDDLSKRIDALGVNLSSATVAALLTGRRAFSAPDRSVVVAAINARLAELAMPAMARNHRP
jgi:hypothetical protein